MAHKEKCFIFVVLVMVISFKLRVINIGLACLKVSLEKENKSPLLVRNGKLGTIDSNRCDYFNNNLHFHW